MHEETGERWRCCRLEAAWIIVNLAYGDIQTVWVLIGDNSSRNEFFTIINEVLNESVVGDLQLFDLVVYFMGNIVATNNESIHKYVLDNIRIPSMCRRVMQDRSAEVSYDLARNFIWLLPNWLGEDRFYDVAVVEDILEMCSYVASHVLNKDDEDMLTYLLKTLKKLSLATIHEQALVKPRHGIYLIDIAVECLASKNEDIAVIALEFLGQMLSVGNLAVERSQFCGILDKVTNISMSAKTYIIKASCFCLSNYVACGIEQCREVSKSFAPERLITLAQSMSLDIKAEALYALTNCITVAADSGDEVSSKQAGQMSVAQRLLAINYGDVVKRLIAGLKLANDRLVAEILAALLVLIEYEEAFERLDEGPFEDFINGYIQTTHPERNLDLAANLRHAFMTKRERENQEVDSPMAFEGQGPQQD